MDTSKLPNAVPTTYVNRGSTTAIGIIFPVLTALFFSLRASRWKRSSFELDDFFIIPGAFMTMVTGVGMVIGSRMNIIGGHSLPVISPTQYAHLGKFEYSFWICHILAITTIKLSIMFLFRRLFKGPSNRTLFDMANWSLITLVVVWGFLFLFLDIFACGAHPARSWTSVADLRGECLDTFAMQTACAVVSWVIDVAILIEPLFMIGSLNMRRKRKVQTSLIFLFSTFAVVAGMLRTIIWIQIKMQDTFPLTVSILGQRFYSSDTEGVISLILFWTYIEIGIGFVVACLPPCVMLIDKLVHSSLLYIRSISHSIFSFTGGRQKESSQDTTRVYMPMEPRRNPPVETFDHDHKLVTDIETGRGSSLAESLGKPSENKTSQETSYARTRL